MIRRVLQVAVAGIVCLCATAPGEAETVAPSKAKDVRRIAVLRTFKVPVVKGEKTEAYLPAMMSFWGATNHQEILKSTWQYSVKPDKTEPASDNRGSAHRHNMATWNNPKVSEIIVTQKLVVQLTRIAALYTRARLPYPEKVRSYFADSLASEGDDINIDNEQVKVIARKILAKAKRAEQAVERVCDWINENVTFESGSPYQSDTVLARRKGNCTGMAHLACAILRTMGIPAEFVSGKFVGGTGGHGYIEVYFPDAGWVFYDLSNGQRGFKEINCLMTATNSMYVTSGKEGQWHSDRSTRQDKDVRPYKEPTLSSKRLRAGPKGKRVVGAKVVAKAPPTSMKVRHRSLSQLLLGLDVPAGKRKYQKVTLNDLVKMKAEEAAKAAADDASKKSSATKKQGNP